MKADRPRQSLVCSLFAIWTIVMSQALAVGITWAEGERPSCYSAGLGSVAEEQRLRDELSRPLLSPARTSMIAKQLQEAVESCTTSYTVVDNEIMGALLVSLGNRFVDEENIPAGLRSFNMADQLFATKSVPSLMWLAAIRGESRANLLAKRFSEAEDEAARQTSYVRSWVVVQKFPRSALIGALKFELQVAEATDQPKKATLLMREIEQLQRHQDVKTTA